MVIYKLPKKHGDRYKSDWIARILATLSFSFVNFQFREDGSDHEVFYMKDDERKTMNDYFYDMGWDTDEDWFGDINDYVCDLVDWVVGEDERVVATSIVKSEFSQYYNSYINSDIISIFGEVIHGLPPNKLGNTSSQLVVLLHIYFKMEINYAQNYIS